MVVEGKTWQFETVAHPKRKKRPWPWSHGRRSTQKAIVSSVYNLERLNAFKGLCQADRKREDKAEERKGRCQETGEVEGGGVDGGGSQRRTEKIMKGKERERRPYVCGNARRRHRGGGRALSFLLGGGAQKDFLLGSWPVLISKKQ